MLKFFVCYLCLVLCAGSALACDVEGIVFKVGAGKFNNNAPDGEGGVREMEIIFTEISLRLMRDSCLDRNEIGYRIRPYGLCEDIDIVRGDHIKAKAEDWNYGGKCLSNVEVLR